MNSASTMCQTLLLAPSPTPGLMLCGQSGNEKEGLRGPGRGSSRAFFLWESCPDITTTICRVSEDEEAAKKMGETMWAKLW